MSENKSVVYLPGDKLSDLIDSNVAYKLGPGLLSTDDSMILVSKPGMLKLGKKDHVWIESSHKRVGSVVLVTLEIK